MTYTRRVGRLTNSSRGPIDGGKHILPAQDRYGYICAKALGLEIPPRLERLMAQWRAIQQARRPKQRIPQAARDRLLAADGIGPGPSAADDAELREAAERTVAKYA